MSKNCLDTVIGPITTLQNYVITHMEFASMGSVWYFPIENSVMVIKPLGLVCKKRGYKKMNRNILFLLFVSYYRSRIVLKVNSYSFKSIPNIFFKGFLSTLLAQTPRYSPVNPKTPPRQPPDTSQTTFIVVIINIIYFEGKVKKQAGAELCQAQNCSVGNWG